MRWYCVLCFCASLLKNSTLRLLSAIVTLTPSSRKTRSSGFGRKSGTTLGSPSGSSVYLILSFIDSLSFPPIAGSEDSDYIVTVSKPNSENPTVYPAETEVPQFLGTMGMVFSDDTPSVGKGDLRHRKGNSVLFLVLLVLLRIPIEPSLRHSARLAQVWP